MEKVVVVCVADGDPLDDARVGDAVVDAVDGLDDARYPAVAVHLLDRDASEAWWGGSPPPSRLLAALSAWTECADDVDDLVELMQVSAPGSTTSAVVVTEAVPRRGAPPGAVLTALLHRRSGSTPEQFVEHWRDVHQPLSFRIHPQSTYVRNVVSRRVHGDATFDGICEEGVGEAEDVLDPARFFGADGGDWKVNRRTIGGDVPRFLDPATTASIMREYRIRDLRPTRENKD